MKDEKPWRTDVDNIPKDGSRVVVEVEVEAYYHDDLCRWIIPNPPTELPRPPTRFRKPERVHVTPSPQEKG